MARIVARNRRDLERALSPITSELLKEKGYLCFVDIFMKLGYLSQVDYEQHLQSSRQNSQPSKSIARSFLSFGSKPFRLKLSGHVPLSCG
jgi:hypothetical protein